MASTMSPSRSSPASSSQLWNYDVYLSFRGEDTRKNFSDHLYAALQERGVLTYKEDKLLPRGEPLGLALLKAIEESRIVVVIFSANYANSPWCLDELLHIKKCKDERGLTVMPLFYHVERSDVENQKGRYKEAFDTYESKNYNKVELWRKALANVCKLPGWELNNNLNSRETKCIKQIVDTIAYTLFPNKDPIEIRSVSTAMNSGSGEKHSKQINRRMVSSMMSSGSSYKIWNHDVFVSFRREDTRNNFVDHLYSALDQQDILTYKEEETLPLGESNDPLHLKAIEEARIAVVVFSKNYADSSWYLDELVCIMKCMDKRGLIVMPVFYHVQPLEVREQTGYFGEAFAKYDQSDIYNKVASWRKALADAGKLFGYRISGIASGFEAKGIKLIVDAISERLFPDKGLIGIQTRLEVLKYGSGGGMRTPAFSPHEDFEHLRISLKDISLATNGFSNIIAWGGFGKVFQGQSEKHGTIAVKQLDRRNGQGDREFLMEISLLTSYKHENIVSLVGFCDEDRNKMLVYKYESNMSLDKHIHSKDLTWIQRLQICLDASNGLKYLHDDVGPHHRILHRDIKSSNILLDGNWKAKISDFGLSKIVLANVPCTFIITSPCGTRGYVDPQYQKDNILTQKSDVYSFGIVLLEVLLGRLVTDVPEHLDERQFSVKVAQSHYEKGTLDEIIDSDIRNQMNSDSLSMFSTIAYRCLNKVRKERPTMSQVVDQLEKALDYQQGSTGFWHDVYITYRDRDTECHTFLNDLRDALHQGGVSTYRDNMIQYSRKESVLIKAIERSSCFVIIFTEKFAVNSWYLDEVAKITECMKEKGQFVLPVFYNVSRSDVRGQQGYFGDVMSEYDSHPRMEVWKNALVEATNATGLEYSNFRSNGDLIRKIVEETKSGLSEQRLMIIPLNS